jgi:hypothetical protein
MYDHSIASQTQAGSIDRLKESRHARFDVDGSERILLARMHDPSRKSTQATSGDGTHDG